jgi:hypothetical protein
MNRESERKTFGKKILGGIPMVGLISLIAMRNKEKKVIWWMEEPEALRNIEERPLRHYR